MRARSLSRSARPAEVGSGAKCLPGRLSAGRAAACGCVAWSSAARKALRLVSMPLPPDLMMASNASRRKRQRAGCGQRAEQAGGDDAVIFGRQRFHVERDDALGCDAGRVDDDGRIGGGVAGFFLLRGRIQTVGRRDQGGAVRRHQAAQDGAAGLDQFGGKHDVDFALRRHQRQDRRAAPLRRQHLDVIDRGAGALRDARHRGRLGMPALRLGESRRSSRPARRRPGRPSP